MKGAEALAAAISAGTDGNILSRDSRSQNWGY